MQAHLGLGERPIAQIATTSPQLAMAQALGAAAGDAVGMAAGVVLGAAAAVVGDVAAAELTPDRGEELSAADRLRRASGVLLVLSTKRCPFHPKSPVGRAARPEPAPPCASTRSAGAGASSEAVLEQPANLTETRPRSAGGGHGASEVAAAQEVGGLVIAAQNSDPGRTGLLQARLLGPGNRLGQPHEQPSGFFTQPQGHIVDAARPLFTGQALIDQTAARAKACNQ